MMSKVTIIGCAGSGKTTFAKKLASKLNLPLHTIDSLYYGDDWQKISQGELQHKLIEIMNGTSWIIDGQYTKLIPLRLEYVDTVLFFDFPKVIALWRILKRYFRQKMGMESVVGNNYAHFPWHQIKLVLTYPTRQVHEMLKCASSDVVVLIFRKPKDADIFLDNIS